MYRDPSVITIKGANAGKTLAIIAGVHGNEICGIEAVRQTIDTAEISSGKVHFIFANLAAIALNVRQTQMNFNRAFCSEDHLNDFEKESYERKRALELIPYLDESDALLDIHSSRNIKMIPFIIYEPNSIDIAKRLPFPIRSRGWNSLFPGGVDYYINRRGGKGICIECGYHMDPEAPKRAIESINLFLGIMGVIPLRSESLENNISQREIYVNYVYRTKTNFCLARSFSDFELLKKTELIGHDGDKAIFAPEDGIIIFPHNLEDADEDAFVFGQEIFR